ncbi:hypothetical protein [Solwaraspora sp. WMMA2065]|uniref:hypothetical protein n=1 Tax=Solwaraspora sp. WMMA2065 TaxID=3015166 RepID=UPI00259BC772|nr:hypothetical protein [Solwaraspora sp. WMMA2065]WJK34214.1 hypothetical protein O7610_26975 [Solwaraspora sp. WMMA2065]
MQLGSGDPQVFEKVGDGLPDQTRQELYAVLADHATEVVEEAGRLAADPFRAPGASMITPAMIRDAHFLKIKGYVKRRSSKKSKIATVALFFLAYVGGIFTNNITRPWGSIGFAVCAALAVIAFMGGRDE